MNATRGSFEKQPRVARATDGSATVARGGWGDKSNTKTPFDICHIRGNVALAKLDDVWPRWNERAEADKKASHKTDQDIAVEVSEMLGYEVGRALVNHWFRGRRDPSLREFMALCTVLGSDPGAVLLDVRTIYKPLHPHSDAARVLRDAAKTPEYLVRQAARLRRFKSKRRKARVRA